MSLTRNERIQKGEWSLLLAGGCQEGFFGEVKLGFILVVFFFLADKIKQIHS